MNIYAQINKENDLISAWYTAGMPSIDTELYELIEMSYEESMQIKNSGFNFYDRANNEFIFKIVKSEEQIKIDFRAERNDLLNKVDKAINIAEDLGKDSKDLREYRQALRDATIRWVFPESII